MSLIKPLIYIVDDDPDDREFIIQAFMANGFTGAFVEFDDGQKVLDYLKSYPIAYPDLIMLDLNMPIKNGFATLQDIKSNEFFPFVPIVILTASSSTEDEKVSFQHGCEQYRQKPLSIEGYKELARSVTTFFQK